MGSSKSKQRNEGPPPFYKFKVNSRTSQNEINIPKYNTYFEEPATILETKRNLRTSQNQTNIPQQRQYVNKPKEASKSFNNQNHGVNFKSTLHSTTNRAANCSYNSNQRTDHVTNDHDQNQRKEFYLNKNHCTNIYPDLSNLASNNQNKTEGISKSSYYDIPPGNLAPGCNDTSTIVKNVSNKHEIFLKKISAEFSLNPFIRNKGFYCNVCNYYEVRMKRHDSPRKQYHDKTEMHLKNILHKGKADMIYCRNCKANFFGDVSFWIHHLNTDMHKFFSDKVEKQNWKDKNDEKKNSNDATNSQCDNMNKSPKTSVGNVEENEKNNFFHISPDLVLRKDIIVNFHESFSNKDNSSFNFYCHSCQLWMTDEDKWIIHNKTHDSDIRKTLASCIDCHLLMVGSDKLKEFHTTDKAHEIFIKSLEFIVSSFESDEEECDCDSNDGNINENQKEEASRMKKMSVFLKGLPSRTSREMVFDYMKDFGRVAPRGVYMNYHGPNSAKVTFLKRFIAINIVNNEVPIKINNKLVESSLIEE